MPRCSCEANVTWQEYQPLEESLHQLTPGYLWNINLPDLSKLPVSKVRLSEEFASQCGTRVLLRWIFDTASLTHKWLRIEASCYY